MLGTYDIVINEAAQNASEDIFFCPLCGFTMQTALDFQSHSDHGCCHECFITFVESRKNEWESGWRPKKSEIRKYINNRKRLIINKGLYRSKT